MRNERQPDPPPLSDEDLARAVEVLRPFVSESRQERIEAALASRTRDLVLVLEDIYDERNASAVLRTAEAFGVYEVHIVERTTRFVIHSKTSRGAHKWLEVHKHKGTDAVYGQLRARGYRVWASSVHGDAVDVGEIAVDGPIALVFGNEHEGLSPGATAAADGRFRVPMHGFVESLNVSVATAVSMYDVLTRKRALERPLRLSSREQLAIRAEWFASSVRASRPLLARANLALPRARRVKLPQVDAGEPGAPE